MNILYLLLLFLFRLEEKISNLNDFILANQKT